MPHQTFFNLPEEKRERIVEAIRAECARVPIAEVSINRIVRDAEIPRGSFYQYFEDKTDMVRYILTDYHTLVYRAALESLTLHHGDVFQMFVDMLDYTVAFVTKEETNAFLRNLFSDVRINMAFIASFVDQSKQREEIIGEIVRYVDVSALDIRGEDDLMHMFDVFLLVTCQVIARAFFDLSRYDEIREDYIDRLTVLKRGFLKDKQ